MFKNKKHIIFDWNGTLIDDAKIFVEVLNVILKEQQLNAISLNIYKDCFTFPIKKFYDHLGVNTDKNNFKKIEKKFVYEYKLRQYNGKLHTNIKKYLSMLVKKNISLSILSASNQSILRNLVSFYKINHLFDNIYGVNNHAANGKIKRGHELIKKINLVESELVLVGDTDYDYSVASNLNIDCVLVSNGHQSIKQLKKTDAIIVNDLKDLISLF